MDQFQTFTVDEALPDEATELFGDEVREAFDDARRSDGAAPKPIVIAAIDGGWRAGVYLLVEEQGGERVASIRQLVVRPAHRGRGLGGWLLRRAQSVAEEHGCARLRSTAGWGCPDHVAMYDRLGYDRVRGESPYLVSKAL